MKKWLFIFVMIFLATSLTVGCNSTDVTNQGLTVTDALGNEVTVVENPERIISLIPSITETIFALDKGDQLVGRTDWCNYPEQVTEIASVGDMQFDVEKVLSLKPDLVLSHESSAFSSEEGLEQLRNAGITIVVVKNDTSINDVLETIELIGEVIGTHEKAKQLTAEMNASFTAISEKVASISEEDMVTVWVEVSPAPDIFTTGQGTFMHEMLELINANNSAGNLEGWVAFTEEDAVSLNPDVIVTTYGHYIENAADQVKSRQGWKEVTAVKNDRVYDIHSDKVTRSGPRLAEGVEELAAIIYPQIFGK
jgi:iron complex transport system substrate-binding protein